MFIFFLVALQGSISWIFKADETMFYDFSVYSAMSSVQKVCIVFNLQQEIPHTQQLT